MGQDQLDEFLREQLGQHQTPIDNGALWKGIEAKKSQEIETIVKDKLANHESTIDSQAIWNNISAEVTGKSSTPWLSKAIGLLLAIGLLSVIAINNYSNKSEVVDTEDKVTTNLISESASNETPSDISVNGTSESQVSFNESNTNITSEASFLNSENISTKLSGNNMSDSSNELRVSGSVSNNQKRANSSDNNNRTIENNNTRNNSNAITGNSRATERQINIDKSYDSKESTNTGSVVESETTNTSNNRSANAELSQAHALSSNQKFSLAQNIKNPSDFLDGLPAKDECFSWSKSVECYDYSPKKLHFSILAYTTADYYRKSMSVSSELTQNYLNNRKESQKAQISNRSGLQVVLRHRKGMYVKFGAEAGFIRERFSHQTRDTTIEILPNQLIRREIVGLDTFDTYGNGAVTTISSKNWRVNNSHRTIGIPILVGYEKKLSKFSLGVELGVLYNIHRSFEGWLLGPPDAPADAKDYFSSSNDLNVTGGVNLNFDVNEKFRLVGLANFRQNMNTINNLTTNGVNQKNTIFGLGVGLEFKI